VSAPATNPPLRPALERLHREWLEQVDAALQPARSADASIWVRWGAAQYVEHELLPHYRRELAAIGAVLARAEAGEKAHLWALGELIELLSGELGELVQLAQSGAAFAASTNKLLRALECWCRAVESAAGRGSWQALGPEARARLARLTAATHAGELAGT
jgi:hypothetical protein